MSTGETWDRVDRKYRAAKVRIEYLKAIQRLFPEVAEDLEANVPPEGEEGRGAFSDALKAWGNRRHLEDDWILVYARDLLLSGARPLRLGTVGLVGYALPEVVEQPPPYRPALESRKEYQARVDSYVWAVEKAYRRAGWEPTQWKPGLTKHLEWLARNVVGEESYTKIADNAGKPDYRSHRKTERASETAIGNAIREARKLIEDREFWLIAPDGDTELRPKEGEV